MGQGDREGLLGKYEGRRKEVAAGSAGGWAEPSQGLQRWPAALLVPLLPLGLRRAACWAGAGGLP